MAKLQKPKWTRIDQIVHIVKSMENNDAAHYSPVTHVIFSDYNLDSGFVKAALFDDSPKWKDYIDELFIENDKWTIADALLEIGQVIEALYKLYEFSDGELVAAGEILLGQEEAED